MCSWLQWSVCVFKCVLKCRWWWPDSIYYSWRAGWDFFLLCVGCKKTLYALHQAFSALNETICGAEMCVRCSNAIWHMLRLRIEIKNSWWVIMTMSSSSSPLGMNNGISASERIFFSTAFHRDACSIFWGFFLMVGVCCYYVHHSIVSCNDQLVCYLFCLSSRIHILWAVLQCIIITGQSNGSFPLKKKTVRNAKRWRSFYSNVFV